MEDLQSQIAERRRAGDLADFCRKLHDGDEVAFKDACKKYLSYGEIKDCVYPIYQSILDWFRKDKKIFDALFDKLNDGCFQDEDGYNEFLWIGGCEKFWEDVFAEPFDNLVLWPLLTEQEKAEFRVLHHFRLLEELWADEDECPGRSEYKDEVLDYCSKLSRSAHDSAEYKRFIKLCRCFDEENREAFYQGVYKKNGETLGFASWSKNIDQEIKKVVDDNNSIEFY